MYMKKKFVSVMVFSFITSFLSANSLELGSPAPQLKVLTDQGTALDLGEALSVGTTLVFFYPKAMTPGCVKQACSLRDGWDKLQSRNVSIFGVSSDTAKTQAQFRDKYTLPFTLLADTDGKIADAFSKSRWSRQAYIFKDGILVWRDLKAATSEQATEILVALDELEPNS
jgi:peroxiredoxin Q/BCP